MHTTPPRLYALLPYTLVCISICACAVAGYYAWTQREGFSGARTELQTSVESITALQEQLEATKAENDELRSLLQKASQENAAFGARVQELASSVTFLDKLSKTDRELLQKYSSVYFLSENFIPDPLVPVDEELLARPGSNVMIHGSVFPFLKDMMQAAAEDDAPLLILSGYRSFGEQSSLKSGYKVTYGAGANQFSADQGYSEHQLGTTVDFTSPENPLSLVAFDDSPGFTWLIKNAHKYGFVLSYPHDNSFFQYEPWHWRFVGVDLAALLYNDNKYFYDLDQREINAYLTRIFD